MLTHSITPHTEYREPAKALEWLGAPPKPTTGASTSYGVESKIGYAQYIGNLPMDRNDWVVEKKVCTYPFTDAQMYRVVDIQEMFWMAEWDRVANRPKCLQLEDHYGVKFWANPELYFMVSTMPSEHWGTGTKP